MPVPANRSYSCTACGKHYARKNHLSRHKATHDRVSRYECHGCEKTFSRSDVLRKHWTKCPRKHDNSQLPQPVRGRKPKSCEQCARSKVTCDKAEPCGRCCVRRLTCSYARVRRDASTAKTASNKSSQLGDEESDGGTTRSGATFLLSLTNPKAATMLESFADDDPAALPDMATTSSAEEAFLRSLDSFMMDLGYPETDEIDVPFPSGDLISDLPSPVFRPEALAILQNKTEPLIHDLHQLHQSLAAYDPCYHTLFDRPTAKQVLAPESIIRFAATYFHLSHHHVPIVHRPSFGSPHTATTLLLAVTLAGALRSPPRDDALSVWAMARLFEEYIFLRLADIMSTYPGTSLSLVHAGELLETLQAAILLNNVQFMDNNIATRRRIRTQRLPALVASVRRLGLFAMRQSTAAADWAQHVQEQSCIRIAHWTAMADWHQSIMFHMPPLVTISELTGDMPGAGAAWDAESFLTSEGKDCQPEETSAQNSLRSVSDYIRVLMQDSIEVSHVAALRRVSMSNMYLIITGLSCAIVSGHVMSTIAESAPALERALRRWQDVWKFLAQSRQGACGDLAGCGIERYSDGQCWAARRMLESLVPGDEPHAFFQRVGHDTLAEFHGFLAQQQKKSCSST
ncbi:hypothetical protein JDV02_006139 [Purpureocillium takamizusanense]|uniref:Uncharacterized protein n=1 Tax=Purpureocillium takamizusanense TaxID=2060973 RepID=A0A9Q8QK10_9HYPO|nr:uncharacterized protein JDV02_006139 [Purpureocillium takamizusanense]UNI20002.1 hypothetical protein JDV02_006139 [Purpureocillium takamizusanense]